MSQTSVLSFWQDNRKFLEEKGVQQMLTLCGSGRLSDGNSTSSDFRELLDNLPSATLRRYADECLQSSFDGSGFALQDLINQIGKRLGYAVEYGLYRGKSNAVGFDGLWTTSDAFKHVVEVKTTDAYRINLDTLASYRNQLVEAGELKRSESGILIVVGRQDTGDLEAQIRGSRHAWDVRLISVEALVKLMSIRENLSDTDTAQRISEVLRPLEYTRVDGLIELMFRTSEDMQLEEELDDVVESTGEAKTDRPPPSNFHDEAIDHVSKILDRPLIKEGRSRYTSADRSLGITCAVSKPYPKANETEYWYAFHPAQQKYLAEKQEAYVCYGCGSPDNVVLMPLGVFQPLLEKMWTTTTSDRHYWHIHIYQDGEKTYLNQGSSERVDISEYLLPKESLSQGEG